MILQTCVYIVHALTTNYYKIGKTINIKARLSGLQTTIPFWDIEAIVIHYCTNYEILERQLHEKYADQQLRNSEWFVFTDDEITELIETNNLIDTPESAPPVPKRTNWSKHSTTMHDLFSIPPDRVEEIENIKPIIGEVIIQDTALERFRQRLKQLRDEQGMKWRDIGEMPEFNGVSFGTLNAIYHGREPKATVTRRKLGLPFIEVREIYRNSAGRFSKRSG